MSCWQMLVFFLDCLNVLMSFFPFVRNWFLICGIFIYCGIYLYMESQFFQAWLAHSSREINQIMGGSDPLRGLNFENCESEPYINDVILSIPLYCKFFDDHRCTWLKDYRSTDMKL